MGASFILAFIVVCGATVLWFALRALHTRTSQPAVRRPTELEAALLERDRTYDATLGALTNALDVRDSETGGHGDRVVSYMELILRELGIIGDELAMLRRGALLHDIGKIGVPDNVLRKPTALSESEWTMMKRHPEFGARIIAGIPFLEEVSRIVRHHHERWDGMGYPDGLSGTAIPTGARIFAVADSFDAMTSDRPYRRSLSIDAARTEIDRCSGTQFDPSVVTAFLRVPIGELEQISESALQTYPRVVAS
jgi:putative nucleotidyltransferase with HDIG domain